MKSEHAHFLNNELKQLSLPPLPCLKPSRAHWKPIMGSPLFLFIHNFDKKAKGQGISAPCSQTLNMPKISLSPSIGVAKNPLGFMPHKKLGDKWMFFPLSESRLGDFGPTTRRLSPSANLGAFWTSSSLSPTHSTGLLLLWRKETTLPTKTLGLACLLTLLQHFRSPMFSQGLVEKLNGFLVLLFLEVGVPNSGVSSGCNDNHNNNSHRPAV